MIHHKSIALFLAAVLGLSVLHAEWSTSHDVTVWVSSASKKRSFQWSGTTDSEGKADGPGTFTVYFEGKKVATYVGEMGHGRMNGGVVATYHKTGMTYRGEIRDWNENGMGTMTYADGRTKSGRWQDGNLVESGALAEESAPALGVASSAPSPAVGREGDVFGHLAPGLPAPGPSASASERFLYELSGATQSYLLDTSYRASVGNNVYTDAYWALFRGIAVQKLVASPNGSEVPQPLREFCLEAIGLDASLQIIARAIESTGRSARDETQDLFIEKARSAWRGQEQSRDRTWEVIGGMILRAMQVEQMAASMLRLKQEGDFHRRWAQMLDKLAAQDPALKPYAREPRLTDPTWHFLRGREMGDEYFGETVATRGARRVSIDSPSRKVSIGNLGDGPILVRISQQRSFVYELSFDLPPGPGPVITASCSRGHFGYDVGQYTPWAARGLTDPKFGGRLDRSGSSWGTWKGRVTFPLFHLATIGKGEDTVTEGTLLIYRRSQASSDEEAARIARRVDL